MRSDGIKMLKKSAFQGVILAFLSLFPLETPHVFADAPPEIQIEKLRFFDWEVGSSPQKIAKKACYLQLSGFTHDRVFLSMRLSMVKASPAAGSRNALTILKITATQVFQQDFSDALPIRLSEAWLETSTATTLGNLKNTGKAPHFLGGMAGDGLFNALLRGIRKEGLIIGYRAEIVPLARVFEIGVPPPHLFEGLKTCLAKGAAIPSLQGMAPKLW